MQFQFVIFTQGEYFSIPDSIDTGLETRSPRTVLAIEASDSKNGVVHFWSLKKFRERLKTMKDLYNKVAMATEHSDGEAEDPFYDDFPWFRLIGRSFVYMRNLFYGISLDQKVPIVNEKAEILGALLVRIETIAGKVDCAKFQIFEIYVHYDRC